MRIAFYAPLKAPDHPVPSGDRQMSRLLIAALRHAGYEVEVASALRAYMSEPSVNALSSLAERACAEIARLEREWQASGPPDLWFTYHPYYKAPDLIGPALCGRFNIPYITAEASYAGKRDIDGWAPAQRKVIAGVSAATVNLCFTGRDRDGLARAAPDAVFDDLRPFIDTAPFTDEPKRTPKPRPVKKKVSATPLRWNPDPDDVQKSVVKLVLSLVEFVRRLMERQRILRYQRSCAQPAEVLKLASTSRPIVTFTIASLLQPLLVTVTL